MATFSSFLADVILIVHTAVVLFILAGLLLIWVGYFKGWTFVRNLWFRSLHLSAMGYVAAQSILGIACPLTVWENQLRNAGGEPQVYEQSFVAHWLGRILFYDISETVFTVAYLLFFGFMLFTWFKVRPNARRRRESPEEATAKPTVYGSR